MRPEATGRSRFPLPWPRWAAMPEKPGRGNETEAARRLDRLEAILALADAGGGCPAGMIVALERQRIEDNG